MRPTLLLICAAAICSGQAIENEQSRAALRAALDQALSGPVEPLSAIAGPVIKNLPFSATVTREMTQTLASGAHIRQQNSYNVCRDGQGRVREEVVGRRITISDPVANLSYFVYVRSQTVVKRPLAHVVNTNGGSTLETSGAGQESRRIRVPAPEGNRSEGETPHVEDLGVQNTGGVPARGTRTTVNLPAGAVGNDVPLRIEQERWFSPDLQIVTMTRSSDPRTGEITIRYSNIHRGEPDPSLFQPPAGYKIETQPQ